MGRSLGQQGTDDRGDGEDERDGEPVVPHEPTHVAECGGSHGAFLEQVILDADPRELPLGDLVRDHGTRPLWPATATKYECVVGWLEGCEVMV